MISSKTLAFSGLCLWLGACASSPPTQANTPDPSLDEPSQAAPGAVLEASSGKVQQGMDALERKDFEGARKVLAEARSEAPKDPQAAHYLGVALENLGDVDGAQKEYRAALELDPKLIESSANLFAILLDAGKPRDALVVLDAALKSAPKDPNLLVNRALALESAGSAEDALEAYGAAVEVRPDDAELRMAYADLLISAGKKDVAFEQVRAAGSTDDPEKLAAVAHRFGKLGKFADCVAALDRVIEKKPAPEHYVRRGICRHEANDLAGERADYEAALKLDARSAPAHYYLGRSLAKREPKTAQKHLATVVDLTKGEGDLGRAAKQALAELKRK